MSVTPPAWRGGLGEAEDVDWVELVAENRIQEAMEQGLFDDLPDKGRPLVLEEYPFVPPGLRVPYKILHDAGWAPDWIQAAKEIREREARLAELQDGHLLWLRREREARRRLAASGSPEDREAARVRLDRAREAQKEVLGEVRRLLEERNAAVDRYNRRVPQILWQKGRWPVEERLQRFRATAEAAFPEIAEAHDAPGPGPRP